MDKNTILTFVFMLGQYFVISLIVGVIIVFCFDSYKYFKEFRNKTK